MSLNGKLAIRYIPLSEMTHTKENKRNCGPWPNSESPVLLNQIIERRNYMNLDKMGGGLNCIEETGKTSNM